MRLRFKVVGAVPEFAESEAPGIPLTIAVNGSVPVVAPNVTGTAAGVGAVNV